MGHFGLIIAGAVLAVVTAGSFFASARGWGLPGGLEKPVSIRQHSTNDRPRHRSSFVYFGHHRRHSRGGFLGGK
ncbi:MAG: hypothetical protein JXR96_24840 [Deltaproteobacteria bacterium]|nr:hypothetical protein [Deltaproteobacteria bacterium]